MSEYGTLTFKDENGKTVGFRATPPNLYLISPEIYSSVHAALVKFGYELRSFGSTPAGEVKASIVLTQTIVGGVPPE